jgi:phage terminase small subunit
MAGISTKLWLDASDFVRGIDRSKKSANSLKTSMSSIGSGISSAFSGVAKSVGAIGIAATGAAAAVGGIAYKLISIGEEGLQAENRIKSVVKTMGLFGTQSGDVASRLIEMADATELATGVDGDLIMAAQAKLATFKELAKTAGTTGGAFDRATQASVDMAAVFGGDASNYAVQLGKALEDPEKGLAALKRTGALTTSQIKAISEEFAATGNRAKAFDQVLKAIETQVGGAANATASGMSRIKVSIGQMLEEVGKPMAEVFSQFAADVAAMTPQIVASLSSLAPKIREVGSTLAAALSEGLAGDTSRLVKIGELMGEAVALGLKVAITRTLIETEESIRRFLENLPGIKQIYGFDPFDQAGEKPSEYIRKGKGRVTEGQIEDGIARIQSIFEEISIDSNPKLGNPNLDSFNEDQRKRREARGANKPILPTEPDTPEGPSDKQKAKAEELRLAQEAYRLEAEMVRARIAGNEKKIADLERQKAIQEEIVALNKLGMTGKDLKADSKLDPKKAEEKARERIRQTAAKMVDARAAADEADKAREKKPQGGPSAGVSQLGSVAKATNVLMGRAANDGILEENRRQTSLLRTIKENTKPKTTNPPEVPIPVFA